MNRLDAIVEARGQRAADDPASPVLWCASTSGLKSDGIDLRAKDWELSRFHRHPVILWGHDYLGQRLPIGTGAARVDGERLLLDVTYDAGDAFALEVRRKALLGMIGGSVGWETTDGRNVLLEFSNVPVGLDADSEVVRARSVAVGRDLAAALARALSDGLRGELVGERHKLDLLLMRAESAAICDLLERL